MRKKWLFILLLVISVVALIEGASPGSVFRFHRISRGAKVKYQFAVACEIGRIAKDYRSINGRLPNWNSDEDLSFLSRFTTSSNWQRITNSFILGDVDINQLTVVAFGKAPDDEGFVFAVTGDGDVIKVRK